MFHDLENRLRDYVLYHWIEGSGRHRSFDFRLSDVDLTPDLDVKANFTLSVVFVDAEGVECPVQVKGELVVKVPPYKGAWFESVITDIQDPNRWGLYDSQLVLSDSYHDRQAVIASATELANQLV